MARPGRKPGTPKTGGRKAGVPNKATADIKALAQEHGPAVFNELVKIALEGDTPASRVSAIKEVLDRGYGKPAQPVSHGGPDGEGPIQHAIEVIFVGVGKAEDKG